MLNLIGLIIFFFKKIVNNTIQVKGNNIIEIKLSFLSQNLGFFNIIRYKIINIFHGII